MNGADVEGAVKAFAEFEAKRPKLAQSCYFIVPRLSLLMKAKKFDDARVYAEEAVAKASEQDDSYALRGLAATLRSPAAKADKSLVAMAVPAAEAALKSLGDKDLFALLGASEACKFAGDADKSKEYGKKAVPVAEAAVKADGDKKNSMTLMRLADAHFAAGDTAKAKEVGQQAVDAAPNDQMKDRLKKLVEKYDAPAKDGEK